MLFLAEHLDKALKGIGLACAVMTLLLLAFAAHFRELSDISALDMAQIARNVAEGKGYVTFTP
ncbi:MAG: hypothetical protein GX600_11170, partial [Dehalococcoidia bacterium]|nr:hypothetical protein [Dehalococcoidia bacterium]